jgi:DNA modification methylase
MMRFLHGDALTVLRGMPDGIAQTCVTSPPYYGLRDYGVAGQIGLEESPDAYVARLVDVFREVRRVLRDDGTLWLNLGDSYANNGASRNGLGNSDIGSGPDGACKQRDIAGVKYRVPPGYKPKDLLGIPWLVAFALRADGWYLRKDIIWHKPNPMPESVRDRPTSAHEHVFLLSKRASYFYDAEAIAEESEGRELFGNSRSKGHCEQRQDNDRRDMTPTTTRNARDVWTIAPRPFSGAHFATMPPDLAERCIKAGSKPGDTVLDPFGGAGTTAFVARKLDRDCVSIELNRAYIDTARRRLGDGSIAMSFDRLEEAITDLAKALKR